MRDFDGYEGEQEAAVLLEGVDISLVWAMTWTYIEPQADCGESGGLEGDTRGLPVLRIGETDITLTDEQAQQIAAAYAGKTLGQLAIEAATVATERARAWA